MPPQHHLRRARAAHSAESVAHDTAQAARRSANGVSFPTMKTALAEFFRTAQLPEVQAAMLFGSHSHDRAHAESDVDVAVLLDRGRMPTRSARAAFAERLAVTLIESLHHNRVDVVVLNDAPPELAVAALDGSVLHVSAPEALHTFNRDARLRLADIRPFLDRTRRVLLDAVTR